MSNRIRSLSVFTHALSPVEADLRVRVEADSGAELRGRLIGPTSEYAGTIEVAYPLRPLPGQPDDPLLRRVVVPEPSLWSPSAPFLYRGVVELWQDGTAIDRVEFRHGFRSARLRPSELLWNGEPLKLRAVERSHWHENELPTLRQAGVNALIVDDPAPTMLAAAERFGLVVLARLTSPATPAQSPALLGWLLPRNWRHQEASWHAWLETKPGAVGMAHDQGPIPGGVHFLIGGPPVLPRLLVDDEGELGRVVTT